MQTPGLVCPIYGSNHSHPGHISNRVISLIFWVLSHGHTSGLESTFSLHTLFSVDLSLRVSLGNFLHFSISFLSYLFYMLMDSFYFFLFEYIWFTMLCFRCPVKWFSFTYTCTWASHLAQLLKNHPAMKEIWVHSLGWEDMFRGTRWASSVFWPGESHGQRSLAGHSP